MACAKIEKYSVWKKKKAVQIGFIKIALGKIIGKNDEVIYFTK